MPVIVAIVISMMGSFNPSALTVPVAEAATLAPQQIWQNALAIRESGGNCMKKHLDTNDYYSYGKYQYQMGTWLRYSFLGTTRQNIYDCDLQDTVTTYILNIKGSGDWYNSTKYLEDVLKLGPYPVAS